MVFKRKNLLIGLLLLLSISCGPKPQPQIQPKLSAYDIWTIFESRYDSVRSLALSGSFVIKGVKTYECKLQLVYTYPDSFAFLAEGTLGIDAARGAIVDGIGFWEIPREKYSEEISIGDKIIFDGSKIDLDILLQAVFFMRHLDRYSFIKKISHRYQYVKNDPTTSSILDLNAETATPIRQSIRQVSYSGYITYQADYFAWQKIDNTMTIPGRIVLDCEQDKMEAEYIISKIKVNPKIPLSFYSPKP